MKKISKQKENKIANKRAANETHENVFVSFIDLPIFYFDLFGSSYNGNDKAKWRGKAVQKGGRREGRGGVKEVRRGRGTSTEPSAGKGGDKEKASGAEKGRTG